MDSRLYEGVSILMAHGVTAQLAEERLRNVLQVVDLEPQDPRPILRAALVGHWAMKEADVPERVLEQLSDAIAKPRALIAQPVLRREIERRLDAYDAYMERKLRTMRELLVGALEANEKGDRVLALRGMDGAGSIEFELGWDGSKDDSPVTVLEQFLAPTEAEYTELEESGYEAGHG